MNVIRPFNTRRRHLLSPKNSILEVNYVVIGNFGHILGDLSSLPRLRRRLGAGGGGGDWTRSLLRAGPPP